MKLLRTIFNELSRWGWLLFVVEPSIVKICPSSEKRMLALFGWIVCLNHVLLAISALNISQLITDEAVSIYVISLLLFLGLSAMYRLLLTTFSSDRLPHTSTIGVLNSSIFISLFFLTFISLLVAKPLELVLFEEEIVTHLEEFRTNKSQSFFDNNLIFLDQEIELIEEKLTKDLSFLPNHEKITYQKRLDEVCQKRQQYINEFEFANANSKYIVARFQLLYDHFKVSWWISLAILALFLIPFLGKISWFKNSIYQLKCDNKDYELILTHFFQCQSLYRNIFLYAYQVEVSLHENYLDPPFNTRKREDTRKVVYLVSLLERMAAQNQGNV